MASLLGTASTCDDSGRSSALSAVRDAAARAPLSRHASIASSEVCWSVVVVVVVMMWVARRTQHYSSALAWSGAAALPPTASPPLSPFRLPQISGSVQLDSGAVQPLLSPASPGLRHYRVPQHLHWPDALGQDAVCVCLAPEALPDLRQACLEFLAALPLLSVEGVACVTAALPPIMRLAQLPAEQLQAELDGLLHSGRTLMLQVRPVPAWRPASLAAGAGHSQACLPHACLAVLRGTTRGQRRHMTGTTTSPTRPALCRRPCCASTPRCPRGLASGSAAWWTLC